MRVSKGAKSLAGRHCVSHSFDMHDSSFQRRQPPMDLEAHQKPSSRQRRSTRSQSAAHRCLVTEVNQA